MKPYSEAGPPRLSYPKFDPRRKLTTDELRRLGTTLQLRDRAALEHQIADMRAREDAARAVEPPPRMAARPRKPGNVRVVFGGLAVLAVVASVYWLAMVLR